MVFVIFPDDQFWEKFGITVGNYNLRSFIFWTAKRNCILILDTIKKIV